MLLYARSDVTGFGGYNGCPGHREPADPHDPHFSIECPSCHPFLSADPLWAASPHEVPLTKAEQKQLDAQKHQAELGAAQMGLAFQQLLRDQLPALAGPEQDELARLRARVAELESTPTARQPAEPATVPAAPLAGKTTKTTRAGRPRQTAGA